MCRNVSGKSIGLAFGPGVMGLTAVALAGCGMAAMQPPLAVAEKVDLARYVGTWYEIARYPNSFERGCAGVTAEYTIRDDGTIGVVNTCLEGGLDGPTRAAEAFAVVTDQETNAKLKVYFFYPFGGDYWILELDPEYQWAVVGEPSRTFLWILSRTPTLDDAVYQGILSRLPDYGYDPNRLEMTPQDVGG